MGFTKNTNIAKIPVGATDWVALVNGFIDAYESGRTIKLVAGENIQQFKAITIRSDGKAYLANHDDIFIGIASNSAELGEDVYVFRDVGNEIAFGSWVVGQFIYIGNNGDLTQTQIADSDEPIGIAISVNSFVLIDKNNTITIPAHEHNNMYYTETEIDAILQNYYQKGDVYNKNEINTILQDYCQKEDVYNKNEIDELFNANQTGALGLVKELTVNINDVYYFSGFDISDATPAINIFQNNILQNLFNIAQVYFADNRLKIKFLVSGTFRVDAIISGNYKSGDIDLIKEGVTECYTSDGYVEDGYVECILTNETCYINGNYVEDDYVECVSTNETCYISGNYVEDGYVECSTVTNNYIEDGYVEDGYVA